MSLRSRIAVVVSVGVIAALLVPGPSSPATAAGRAASAAVSISPFPDGVTRLSGSDRYSTAVAVSKRYSPGVKAVFVATGADFPDALSAASAAAALGGPLLLTPSRSLPAAVRSELVRLKPARIYISGGAGVVSSTVEAALRDIAPTSRLAGRDRYATARAVVRASFPGSSHAIIATGRSFPDALAASGAAGARRAPVILVDGARSTVDAATIDTLERLGVRSVAIAGGSGVVASGIATQLQRAGYSVKRYGGATRYDTAAAINRAYFGPGSSGTAFLATGADFPDALAGAALAGRLAAPLHLTRRTCVPPVVGDVVDAVGAPATVVLGGTAIVSRPASNGARCVDPITSEPLTTWATSTFDFDPGAAAPYSDRPPVNVHDPSIELDSTGLVIYRRSDTGARSDHPVVYAQYGISALLEYQRTGEKLWLDRATRQGQRLIDTHVERSGAWWFPYRHPWTYEQRTLTPPWYSGMAQGEALSLFVRLAETTGASKWRLAADETWPSFTQPYSASAPWASLVIDDHLYFEEFAGGGQPPLLVLNGHVFAMFGLYDYWRLTGDPAVRRYLDGGAATVLERMMPLVRVPDGVSYYCVQADYCQRSRWQSAKYHQIHSWQLDTLARLTGDRRFADQAALLRSDWSPTGGSATLGPVQSDSMSPEF